MGVETGKGHHRKEGFEIPTGAGCAGIGVGGDNF